MLLSYLKNGKLHRENVSLTFDKNYDVCVAGLGTAGAIAAISSALQSLSTVGIERCSLPGGVAVNGGVFSYYYGSKGGLLSKINNDCYDMAENGYMQSVTDRRVEDSIPPAVKGYMLQKYSLNSGLNLLLDTDILGVYSEGKKILGIKCIKDSKIINIAAKMFIDCTNSAVLSRCFGCEMMGKRKYDGKSMYFSKAVGKFTNFINKDFTSGWWHYDYTHMGDTTDEMCISGVWSVPGMPDLSSPENYCRKILDCTANSPCNEEFAENNLTYLGTVPGERETYHVATKKTLSLSDVVYKTEFKNPLFYTFAPLDMFTKNDLGFEDPVTSDFRFCVPDLGFSVGIEKEMLIAKDAENLLIAGKIIGADHSIAGGIRMKADMEKCGEAAAAIASIAIKDNCRLEDTDYAKLKSILSETGCFDESENLRFSELRKPLGTERKSYAFPKTLEEIQNAFKNPVATRAVWTAAYLIDGSERQKLKAQLGKNGEIFDTNCAIALGMSGDETGRKILCEFINRQDMVTGDELKNTNCSRYIMALSLAQRFCWEETKDTMKDILLNFGKNIYQSGGEKFLRMITSICISGLINISKSKNIENEIYPFLNSLPEPPENLRDIYLNIQPFEDDNPKYA